MRPRLFVGSSREGIDVCRAIQGELAEDCDVTVWDQDVFRLGHGALESLLDALDSSDAGVFVLRPDDVTVRRGESVSTVRDNVLFELGLFIGRLGRGRAFMVTPDDSELRMPSDLAGLTTAVYSADLFAGNHRRAAVGPACTRIRDALESIQVRMAPEPAFQARLDRAMRRMSKDLEHLLADDRAPSGRAESRSSASLQLGRTCVRVEPGRIQDYASDDSRAVIALPANEYFDDECVADTNSSLGAYVQHHFPDRTKEFVREIRSNLADVPSQRVPRAEGRIDESYGIGKAILMDRRRLVLVSATTERAAIGLRAEPHFLYAAIEGVAEVMNENRLSSLTMPVLGSGHGGMPLSIALLFNLLAVRSILNEDVGRKLREVRLVVFEGNVKELSETTMQDILSHVKSA
jgi:O-acetyl-ADP-ribose deacetylase (regulator of RNase III)